MQNYKKIKNLLTITLMAVLFISVANKPSSAQTLPNFFDPPLNVYVMKMSDGYEQFFCLDQHPFDLFDPNTISNVSSVYPFAVPASELVRDGIIDLNGDGQVSGVECELYGGLYDHNLNSDPNAPGGPYLGPQNNGVLPTPDFTPHLFTPPPSNPAL